MLIYGKNVAKAVFDRRELYQKIKIIYIEDNFEKKNKDFVPEMLKSKIKILPKIEMDRLAGGLHQGIMLSMVDYQYTSLAMVLGKDPSFVVLLDHLEDPHNLGAIIRTCVAAGVDAIIIPTDRQVMINATVMKTSAGTLYDIPIVSVVNLSQAIEQLKKQQFWIVGTAMDGQDYKDINYDGKIGLVIGNEGKGMHQLTRKKCDFIASIPMHSSLDSLNASVASGIMIYEVIRHRK